MLLLPLLLLLLLPLLLPPPSMMLTLTDMAPFKSERVETCMYSDGRYQRMT